MPAPGGPSADGRSSDGPSPGERLAAAFTARLPQKAAALVLALALWLAWRLQLPAP